MSKYIELKENLLGNNRQLDRMADEALTKLENMDKLLKKLHAYCNQIGTSQDSKTFRKDLKDKISRTMLGLKEATELVNRMDNVKVNPDKEEQKRNQIQRLRKKCKEKLDEATNLMKKIEESEKKSVQNARLSVQNKDGRASVDQGNNHSQGMSKQWMEMDVDEEIIRERENDITELTKLMAEMNAMARIQGKEIKRQGEDLEIIDKNVQETKQNTRNAEKELIDANEWKKQLVQSDTKCLMIAIVVCVVFVLLFLLSSSPESLESDPTAFLPDDPLKKSYN